MSTPDTTVQTVTALLLPDDKAYIRQQLEPVPKQQRILVYRQYCAVWLEASAAEPCELRRDNTGRRAANIWLRESALLWLVAELAAQQTEVAA